MQKNLQLVACFAIIIMYVCRQNRMNEQRGEKFSSCSGMLGFSSVIDILIDQAKLFTHTIHKNAALQPMSKSESINFYLPFTSHGLFTSTMKNSSQEFLYFAVDK